MTGNANGGTVLPWRLIRVISTMRRFEVIVVMVCSCFLLFCAHPSNPFQQSLTVGEGLNRGVH
jgi:uncharacterized membrane protein YraQ (UPF0718 family)